MKRAKYNSHRWRKRLERYEATGEMDDAMRERLTWDKELMVRLFPALAPPLEQQLCFNYGTIRVFNPRFYKTVTNLSSLGGPDAKERTGS